MPARSIHAMHSLAIILTLALTAGFLGAADEKAKPSGATGSKTTGGVSVVGAWDLDVKATARVLARGAASRKSVTITAGAAQPKTSALSQAAAEKEYQETENFWLANLPAMQTQFVFRKDGTGEVHTQDPAKKQRLSDAFKWNFQDAELQLQYPDRPPKSQLERIRIVSKDELHYPMQPLGGYFVLRPKR